MYKVKFTTSAHRQIKKLPMDLYIRIFNSIISLVSDPKNTEATKLTDRVGYRIRVGDYRVVYTIDHSTKEVKINGIEHRSKVYKKKK